MPLLKPLKTGKPIKPRTKYNKTEINASDGFKKNAVSIIIKVCNVTGIEKIGIGGIATVAIQINAENNDIRTIDLIFICLADRKHYFAFTGYFITNHSYGFAYSKRTF